MEKSKTKTTAKRKPKKGLGDKVEDALKSTGVKGLVELINGGECEGCKKRKEKLNKLFSKGITYNKEKGKATPEQKATIKAIGLDKYRYTSDEADMLEAIYNQINHTSIRLCRKCPNAPKEWKAILTRLGKHI